MTSSHQTGWAPPVELALTEADIEAAMKTVPAYIDLTPQDFSEVYHLAFRHALQRLGHAIRVRDVLQPAVVTVAPDTPLPEVAARMIRNRISGVPVVDAEGRVAGVIAEHDFVTHAREEEGHTVIEILAAGGRDEDLPPGRAHAHTAADIMTTRVHTLAEDTPLPEIAASFVAWKVNRIPVTDEEGRLKGIVCGWDLVQSVLTTFAAETPDRPGG